MNKLFIYLPFVALGMYALGNRESIHGMKKTGFVRPYIDQKTQLRKATWRKAGVYLIKHAGDIVYIGYSKNNLYRTLYRHFQKWNHPLQPVVTYQPQGDYTVRIILTTPSQAPRLESYLIQKIRPRDNENKIYAEITKPDLNAFQSYQDAEPLPF